MDLYKNISRFFSTFFTKGTIHHRTSDNVVLSNLHPSGWVPSKGRRLERGERQEPFESLTGTVGETSLFLTNARNFIYIDLNLSLCKDRNNEFSKYRNSYFFLPSS